MIDGIVRKCSGGVTSRVDFLRRHQCLLDNYSVTDYYLRARQIGDTPWFVSGVFLCLERMKETGGR